jgi:integrase
VTVDDIAERVIHAACLCTSRRTVPVSEYRVPEDGAGLPVGPLARRPLSHQEVVAIISPALAAAIAGLIWHVPLWAISPDHTPKSLTLHALRHTAASAWLSAGADIVAVAAWLGDTVETVYKTYAHLMPDADDRGRKAIDQFFRRPGGEGSALNVPSGDANWYEPTGQRLVM